MVSRNTDSPKVSIGLAVYNGEQFLEEAIRSILDQTFTDFELIISDNASTDSTAEICERYATQDLRIRYSRNETNIGGANNENLTFKLSRGKYFRWAAHDDVLAPQLLEECVKALDLHPDVVLSYSTIVLIDEHGCPTKTINRDKATSERPYKRFTSLTSFDHDCEETYGLMRADILRKTGLQRNYTDSDRTLLAHMSLLGRFCHIPKPLFFKRVHPNMSTQVFTDWRKRMLWFGTDYNKRITLPYWSQLLHYLEIITTAPISLGDKVACYLHMTRWITLHRRWRSLGKDLLLAGYSITRRSLAQSKQPTAARRVASGPKRLALMGPFGFGNLGDAAIQQAMLQNIKKHLPEAEVIGFSLNAEDTQQRHGIPSFPVGRMAQQAWLKPVGNAPHLVALDRINRYLHTHSSRAPQRTAQILVSMLLELLSIIDASKTLRGFDYFLISGGGQLDDYWGGPWYHPYTMLLWSLIARLRGVRLCFVSVGAGPLDHALSRWFVKVALSLAHYRSFRDLASKHFVAHIGFKRNASVYPDLAHSLDLDTYQATDRRPSGRPLVGIGPMAYFDPRVWPERDQQVYMGYLSKLASLVAWLLENKYDILLFPGEAIHDRDVIADLRQLLAAHGIAETDCRVAEPPIETVDDLMSQLAQTDLVVASRFHGVLLAQLLNKPVLALSYHNKIDVLMEDMGQAQYCLPIDRFDIETLKTRFLAMSADCQAIKDRMAAQTRTYREALDEQFSNLFRRG